MEFRLFYQGKLSTGSDRVEKQRIRRCFHPQLRTLWNQLPLSGIKDGEAPLGVSQDPGISQRALSRPVGTFQFIPLVNKRMHLIVELDIIFLRPQEPGELIGHAGDIDNRLKILFDALRMPALDELPKSDAPSDNEKPFHCLLEDDALVTKVSVLTDRLLEFDSDSDVKLLIHTKIKGVKVTWDNIGIIG